MSPITDFLTLCILYFFNFRYNVSNSGHVSLDTVFLSGSVLFTLFLNAEVTKCMSCAHFPGFIWSGSRMRGAYPKSTPACTGQAAMSQAIQLLHRLRPDQTHSAAAPALHAGCSSGGPVFSIQT